MLPWARPGGPVTARDLSVGLENQGIHGRDVGCGCGTLGAMINELPDPVLTQVYRLKAVMDQPLDFGDVPAGHRRVVPLVGGVFTGPELNGNLLPGGSASWQIAVAGRHGLASRSATHCGLTAALCFTCDRAVLADCHTCESLASASAMQRHTLKPLHRTWTGSTRRVFVTVAGRTAVNMLYETYLVG